MSTTVKTGWLKDKEGNKFAPKTLTSQVQTSDGTLFEDKIQADLDELETSVNNKLDTSTASSTYETKTDAQGKLDTAKSYTDTKTSGLASTSSVNTSINTHNTSTSAHDDIRALISDLSTAVNNFLDVDDTTTDQLSEVLTLINNNKGTLESLTTTKVNVSDIVNNLTTNNTDKVLSAAQGVTIKGLIDALQEELDGHTHTVTDITDLIATAAELNYMDGVTSNVQAQLDDKAPLVHTHVISDVTNLQSSLNEKVSVTTTVNGKALSANITLSASDVGADVSGSANTALSSAKTYTDEQVVQKTQVQIITWEDSD